MRLKILGSGASTGVPQPACKCQVCQSRNPFNRRLRQSALLESNQGEKILIDASPDLREQALAYQIDQIDAVIFTHAHADHILGIEDLRPFSFARPNIRIPCYGTEETLGQIRHVFSYIFERRANYQGGLLAQLELREFKLDQSFQIGSIKIEPFLLWHGQLQVAGFRFGSLAYATDCNHIPPGSIGRLKGINILILDSLRPKEHSTHFSIDQAVTVAQELQVERTFLTHLSHGVDHCTVSAQLPSGVELAYDGLEIEFDQTVVPD